MRSPEVEKTIVTDFWLQQPLNPDIAQHVADIKPNPSQGLLSKHNDDERCRDIPDPAPLLELPFANHADGPNLGAFEEKVSRLQLPSAPSKNEDYRLMAPLGPILTGFIPCLLWCARKYVLDFNQVPQT
ncbi:hypothetical protein CERZMDRAFT_100847 [Cercospora zeae-maydis SCOH1-5]|uniref:Uncharacterized protein n=1 Tax=Cercospora zeae-maydis SCOH1-5 TaxID=717836 RepID=A0A6A6F7A2_9PEZI|nr:hypothetical protein CERZMDRAFT_100847 [Cercospora zeae-maydis SCOH1-5]